jgi:predicted metal-dependent phosphoesterase TrpH
MRIDLHAHSSVSDGTDSPAQLVSNAAAAGLDVIALTDHDTTAGWAEAAAEAQLRGIKLLRGAELSTNAASGDTVHMLAYLFDPSAPGLTAELRRAPEQRRERIRRIVENLSADYDISFENVAARVLPGSMFGKPHIAEELAALGIVPSNLHAYDTLLADGSKYEVDVERMSPVTAVRLITEAGGVAVIAHPRDGGRGRGLNRAELTELREAGLFGLEVYHREHNESDRAELLGIAQSLDLSVTGASDYHGSRKPNRLGENTTQEDVLDAMLTAAKSGMELL